MALLTGFSKISPDDCFFVQCLYKALFILFPTSLIIGAALLRYKEKGYENCRDLLQAILAEKSNAQYFSDEELSGIKMRPNWFYSACYHIYPFCFTSSMICLGLYGYFKQ